MSCGVLHPPSPSIEEPAFRGQRATYIWIDEAIAFSSRKAIEWQREYLGQRVHTGRYSDDR